jgi:hypothetical protein
MRVASIQDQVKVDPGGGVRALTEPRFNVQPFGGYGSFPWLLRSPIVLSRRWMICSVCRRRNYRRISSPLCSRAQLFGFKPL